MLLNNCFLALCFVCIFAPITASDLSHRYNPLKNTLLLKFKAVPKVKYVPEICIYNKQRHKCIDNSSCQKFDNAITYMEPNTNYTFLCIADIPEYFVNISVCAKVTPVIKANWLNVPYAIRKYSNDFLMVPTNWSSSKGADKDDKITLCDKGEYVMLVIPDGATGEPSIWFRCIVHGSLSTRFSYKVTLFERLQNRTRNVDSCTHVAPDKLNRLTCQSRPVKPGFAYYMTVHVSNCDSRWCPKELVTENKLVRVVTFSGAIMQPTVVSTKGDGSEAKLNEATIITIFCVSSILVVGIIAFIIRRRIVNSKKDCSDVYRLSVIDASNDETQRGDHVTETDRRKKVFVLALEKDGNEVLDRFIQMLQLGPFRFDVDCLTLMDTRAEMMRDPTTYITEKVGKNVIVFADSKEICDKFSSPTFDADCNDDFDSYARYAARKLKENEIPLFNDFRKQLAVVCVPYYKCDIKHLKADQRFHLPKMLADLYRFYNGYQCVPDSLMNYQNSDDRFVKEFVDSVREQPSATDDPRS
ncbi:Uncharacterised protein g10898 [Pycnogonum litorale]